MAISTFIKNEDLPLFSSLSDMLWSEPCKAWLWLAPGEGFAEEKLLGTKGLHLERITSLQDCRGGVSATKKKSPVSSFSLEIL